MKIIKKIPSWDAFFMGLAFYTSIRSKDTSTKVGAIAVMDDKSSYGGYNGCPPQFEDKLLSTPDKYSFVRHAEENALDFAGLERCRNQKNLVLYITIRPCPHCALKLAHFNVKRVVYCDEYKSTVTDTELLERIRYRGFEGKNPAFTIEKFKGKLPFRHSHMGIK